MSIHEFRKEQRVLGEGMDNTVNRQAVSSQTFPWFLTTEKTAKKGSSPMQLSTVNRAVGS